MANTVEFNIKVNGIQQAAGQFDQLDQTLKDTNQSAQALDKSLSDVAIEGLNSAKSVKELQTALKAATSVQLSGALSQSEMRRLSLELGQARDRLNDVREEAAALAGTRMEIFTNSLSRIREGIFNLDLDKFKSGLSGINIALTGGATGFKALGNAMKGAGIGLLVAAIGYLITNMDKTEKILKKWIPGFESIKNIISGILQTATDFLGITSEAEREAERAEKEADARIARIKQKQDFYKNVADQRKSAEQKTQDNRLALMKEGLEKEIEMEELSFKRKKDSYIEQYGELIGSGVRDREARRIMDELKLTDELLYQKKIADIKKKYEDKSKEEEKRKQDEISKTNDERYKKEIDSLIKKYQDQQNVANEYYKNEEDRINNLAEIGKNAIEDEKLSFEERFEVLKEFYEKGYLTQEYYTQKSKELEAAKVQYQMQIAQQYIGIVSMLGQTLSMFAGENADMAKVGVLIEKAAAIFQVIASTKVAAAQAMAQLGPIAGTPVATAIGINGAAQVAFIVAQSIKAVQDINTANKKDSNNGGSRAIYAKGGLLTGPSHAQGGIMTPFGELEGGEFVMNRKSTMSFLPILEELNKIGNGEPSSNTSSRTAQPIIKTYVLASDVTSQQEAQVKIKRAARL